MWRLRARPPHCISGGLDAGSAYAASSSIGALLQGAFAKNPNSTFSSNPDFSPSSGSHIATNPLPLLWRPAPSLSFSLQNNRAERILCLHCSRFLQGFLYLHKPRRCSLLDPPFSPCAGCRSCGCSCNLAPEPPYSPFHGSPLAYTAMHVFSHLFFFFQCRLYPSTVFANGKAYSRSGDPRLWHVLIHNSQKHQNKKAPKLYLKKHPPLMPLTSHNVLFLRLCPR